MMMNHMWDGVSQSSITFRCIKKFSKMAEQLNITVCRVKIPYSIPKPEQEFCIVAEAAEQSRSLVYPWAKIDHGKQSKRIFQPNFPSELYGNPKLITIKKDQARKKTNIPDGAACDACK